MIAPEMSLLLDEFCSIFNINNSDYRRHEHHELAGSINDRIDNNVKNLLDVFDVLILIRPMSYQTLLQILFSQKNLQRNF